MTRVERKPIAGFIGTDDRVHAARERLGAGTSADIHVTYCGRRLHSIKHLSSIRPTEHNSICAPCVQAIEDEHRRKHGEP